MAQKARFEPSAQRQRLRHRRAGRQVLGRVFASQLDDPQRVACRVDQDSFDDLSSQRRGRHRCEELAGVGVRQPAQVDGRQLVEDAAERHRVAHSEEESDGVGVEPTGDERQHVGRFHVEPFRVVDDTQQRLVLSDQRQQRQRRQTHQKPIRGCPALKAERNPQRASR